MLLAVDIGNTQTVLGLFDGSTLVTHWRLATRSQDGADELLAVLRELFELDALALEQLDAMIVASVVPPLSEPYRLLGSALIGRDPLFLSADTPCGLKIRYAHPAEIGADRIADAVAAIELYGAPVVVVDFGTATNIEVIDKDGYFIGGIIAPGLQTSANALFSAAARLSGIAIEVPASVIGTSTTSAVQSGLSFGEIDRIDGLVSRIFAELGYSAPVVATGGLSRRVVDLSRTITERNDELTLIGLQIAWERTVVSRPFSK